LIKFVEKRINSEPMTEKNIEQYISDVLFLEHDLTATQIGEITKSMIRCIKYIIKEGE